MLVKFLCPYCFRILSTFEVTTHFLGRIGPCLLLRQHTIPQSDDDDVFRICPASNSLVTLDESDYNQIAKNTWDYSI